LRAWQALLCGVAQYPGEAENFLQPLLEAIQQGSLPGYLKPQAGEIDELIESSLVHTLAGEVACLPFVRTVLISPGKTTIMSCSI